MNNNNAFQVILISVDKHNDSFPNATDSRNQKKKKEQQQKKESQPKLSIITQLQFMKNAGFKNISILSNRLEEDENIELQNQINEIKTLDPKAKIELLYKDGFSSTVEAILKIRDQSKDHYIVMNDEIRIKESFIYSMMDRHRLEEAALSVVLRKVVIEQNKKKGQQKKQEDFDIACLAKNDSILAYITSSKNDIKIPTSLFRKFDNVSFRNVQDPCFYIFSKQAMNLFEKRIEYLMQENGGGLSNYSNISLKNDIIPYLLKRQYSENKKPYESQIDFQFKCLVSMF